MWGIPWREMPSGIRVLVISSFLMALGFYTLVPYLALYLSGNLGWSMGLTGLLLGLRQFSQQGLMFFGGALSDKFGWKRAMVVGVAIRALGFWSFAWSDTVPELFFAAFLSGFGGAFFEPANKAAFEALIPRNDRERYFALRDIASGIAFALSTLLGFLLAGVNFAVLSFFAGFFFCLAGIVIYRKLPRLAQPPTQAWASGIWSVARDKAFVAYTALLVGYFYLYTQIWITVPRQILDNFGSKSPVAWYYAVIALTTILLQARISEWARRFRCRFQLVGFGALFMAIAHFSLSQASNPLHLAMAAFLLAFGTMISSPVTYELVPYFAEGRWLGAYYGFNGYALAIGGALSASLGGWTYDLGHQLGMPMLPWYVCLVIGGGVVGGLSFFQSRMQLRETSLVGSPGTELEFAL